MKILHASLIYEQNRLGLVDAINAILVATFMKKTERNAGDMRRRAERNSRISERKRRRRNRRHRSRAVRFENLQQPQSQP